MDVQTSTTQQLDRYPAYRESGVDWLGEVPAHWEVKRLKHVCKINAKTLPENTPKELNIDYVDISSVSFEKGIEQSEPFTFEKAPSRARRLASIGDTIVATVRTYLKAIDIVSEKWANHVFSTGFAVLSPKRNIVPTYLAAYTKSNAFTDQVSTNSVGISYPAINSTDLGNLLVPMPPESEQTAIARYLDERTAQIDRAVARKERLIELLRERQQILVQRAVTKGLDPNAPMRDSGVDWLGEVPVGWEVKSLKHIARLQSGETISSSDFTKEGYPVYGGNGFRGFTNSYTNEGDFALIGRQGALCGNVNYASGKFFASEHAIVVYTWRNQNILWLGEAIKAADFNRLSQSAAQPGIAVGIIKDVQFAEPPPSEQIAIAKFIETTNQKTTQAITLQRTQIERLREYKATLVDAVVTGRVKVA